MSNNGPAGQRQDDERFLSLSRYFAAARAGVRNGCAGPETKFAARYRPKLGKHVVRLATTPDDGYLTRDEALDAAREFRDLCRAALATATAPGDIREASEHRNVATTNESSDTALPAAQEGTDG